MARFPFSAAPIGVSIGLLVFLAVGCGSSDGKSEDSPQARAAIAQYRSFLQSSSKDLAEATRLLLLKVEGGERNKAQFRYAASRVPFGRIKPVAQSFAQLESGIDARAGDVPANELGGFHRIEKALWTEYTVAGITPVARKLHADVEELQRRVTTADLHAIQIAEGASELLADVSASAIAGKEEDYAHIDMLDVAGRIEGAEAAFKAVRPLLFDADPELVEEIEKSFSNVYAPLERVGTVGRYAYKPHSREGSISFVVYTELSKEFVDETAQQIKALGEQLSQVPAQIGD